MARYLIQMSFTAEATAALASNPQDRAQAVAALLERLGAHLESFDYSLGDYDVVAVFTAPDNATAAAVSLAGQAPGHIKAFKTTPLLSQEEFLAVARKASGAGHQAPTRG